MVKNPTSQFALLMVSNIQGDKEKEFFKLLSESSFLVYYTRTDCEYCHIQAPIIQRLAKETGLKVYNASLDQRHLEGFDDYMTDPETRKPAEILKVSTVPTLFLYLKPKLDDATQAQQWIRVATGLTTEDVIKERMIDFVRAYRHAIVTGFKDGRKQYTPDFSQNGMHQLAVENTTLDMPSKDEILTHALQHQ
jgi:thiol-disulfide isomerase/thioredoxin